MSSICLFFLMLALGGMAINGVNKNNFEELAYSQKFEPNKNDCEGIRQFWMKKREIYKGELRLREVLRPIGWQKCFLFNISSGIRDKKMLQRAPPPSNGSKLVILLEKFEVEHADDLDIEEHLGGEMDVLLHLVLSWEDKRLAKMDEGWGGPFKVENLSWIWTPKLTNSLPISAECFGCFIKKVGLYLLPNRRVRALFTIRLREQCEIDYSQFPTEKAFCERYIQFGVPERNLKCQNGEIGLSAADVEHLAGISAFAKYAFTLRGSLDDLEKEYVMKAKMSKKWQPEETSMLCEPYGSRMILKMEIIKEKGPMRAVCLCAIFFFAMGAFFLRQGNAKLLTAFALLFIALLCILFASLQRPPHGFPNGEPKILKFYNVSFFIALANLLGIFLLQILASIRAISIPYRCVLMAKYVRNFPRNFLAKRQGRKRLVEEDGAAGQGEGGSEMVEVGKENGAEGDKVASDSEFWSLLDEALVTILCFSFVVSLVREVM